MFITVTRVEENGLVVLGTDSDGVENVLVTKTNRFGQAQVGDVYEGHLCSDEDDDFYIEACRLIRRA